MSSGFILLRMLKLKIFSSLGPIPYPLSCTLIKEMLRLKLNLLCVKNFGSIFSILVPD